MKQWTTKTAKSLQAKSSCEKLAHNSMTVSFEYTYWLNEVLARCRVLCFSSHAAPTIRLFYFLLGPHPSYLKPSIVSFANYKNIPAV